jgi:hypothetical protein
MPPPKQGAGSGSHHLDEVSPNSTPLLGARHSIGRMLLEGGVSTARVTGNTIEARAQLARMY